MSRLALISVALIALLAPSAHAAPLRYIANLVTPQFPQGHPFKGDSLRLDLTWDASTLSPIESYGTKTVWPITNTVGSLIVIRSASVVGVYAATFTSSPPTTWTIHNGLAEERDAISFPAMRFQVGEQVVVSGVLVMPLQGTFFSGDHPFFPKPRVWSDFPGGTLTLTTPTDTMEARLVTGSITEVPEPSTIALSGFALHSLAALRRRK